MHFKFTTITVYYIVGNTWMTFRYISYIFTDDDDNSNFASRQNEHNRTIDTYEETSKRIGIYFLQSIVIQTIFRGIFHRTKLFNSVFEISEKLN